jgi:hypothetical protein
LFVAAVLALTSAAAPANAKGSLATVSIGSQKVISLSNSWSSSTPYAPDDSTIVVTATFSNLTATSVKLVSFRVCYSGPADSAIAYHPYTRNATGHTWTYSGYVTLYKPAGKSGTCASFYPNKTYYKQADGEMVRVVSQIDGSLEVIAAYYR